MNEIRAQQLADSIFYQVVEPEIRKVADPANWIGIAVTWKESPCRFKNGTFKVKYFDTGLNKLADRQFFMEGEVQVKSQTLTVSVKYSAQGGRTSTTPNLRGSDILPVTPVCESRSWPIADADKDKDCIGQWVRERLREFVAECKRVQPN
jgi:hypothetical protein